MYCERVLYVLYVHNINDSNKYSKMSIDVKDKIMYGAIYNDNDVTCDLERSNR